MTSVSKAATGGNSTKSPSTRTKPSLTLETPPSSPNRLPTLSWIVAELLTFTHVGPIKASGLGLSNLMLHLWAAGARSVHLAPGTFPGPPNIKVAKSPRPPHR